MKNRKLKISLLSFFINISVILFSQTTNHSNWGFSDFKVKTEYVVTDMSGKGIQQKIDEASVNGGGIVIIPSGTIELSTWIILKDNVKLKGTLDNSGKHLTSLIAKKDAFSKEIIYSIIKIPNVTNVTIEDIILDGNNNFASGITVSSTKNTSSNILIANNIVKNIGLIPKCEISKESKDWPTYKKSPTAINLWSNTNLAQYFTVKNNKIYNVAKHGIDVNLGKKFIIQNNTVNNAYMGMDASSGSDEGEISGNIFTNCLYGLKIVNAHNIYFYNNTIYNVDDTPWWDEWINEWNYGTGVPLVLQEAGGKTLKNITIKDNILVPTGDKNQWVFWDVENINSKIIFDNNSKVYSNNIIKSINHPFLFFSYKDIPNLKHAIHTTHKQYFDRLKSLCDRFINLSPILQDSLSDSHDIRQVYFENGTQIIINMSLMYVLTEEKKYKDKAIEWLTVFCNYPISKIGNDGGYHIGTYAAGVGIGYDFLYIYLNEKEKKEIRDRLISVIELGIRESDNSWWSHINIHHDHWLPLAGLGIGATALYGDIDKSKQWADIFKHHIEESMKFIGNDGAWTEGAADWVYAMSLVYPFFDIYKRLFKENMFELSFFKNAVTYRIYNYLPNGSYINHHDSFTNGRYNIMGAASCHLMRKLASEYNNGYAQWMADREEEYDFQKSKLPDNWIIKRGYEPPALHSVGWSFLWYNPTVRSKSPNDLPLYHYFENQGLMILKSGWDKNDITFTFTCAPLGGYAAHLAETKDGKKFTKSELYHIHSLNNSFNLYVNGNYLATPPGEGYQESESNLHNTLTIEGATQYRLPKYYASMPIIDIQDNYSYMVGDATSVYPDSINLKRWYRHIAYLKPNIFVMVDELMVSENKNSGVTIWHMDFDNKINKVLIKNSTITVSQLIGSDKGALVTKLFSENKIDIKQTTLKGQWFNYGQVTASIQNIFSKNKNQYILSVLIPKETPNTKTPIFREIKGDNITGIVFDDNNKSVSTVIALYGDKNYNKLPLQFNVMTKDSLECNIFSLSPNSKYKIKSKFKQIDGLNKYTITINKGDGYTTNSSGSITFRAVGNKVLNIK